MVKLLEKCRRPSPRAACLILISLVILLAVGVQQPSASVHTLPFVQITGFSPDQPQVFDEVGITARIETDANTTMIIWRFGDNETAQDPETQIGVWVVTIHHVFQTPGDYDVQVTVIDALNQTAQDVDTVTVGHRSTLLTFQVSPAHVNASRNEWFTFQAMLTTDQNVPLAAAKVDFWYSIVDSNNPSSTQTWYSAGYAQTDLNGQAMARFKPPADAQYVFMATYEGDSLYDRTDATYDLVCINTPEFPYPMLSLIPILAVLILTRRKIPSIFPS